MNGVGAGVEAAQPRVRIEWWRALRDKLGIKVSKKIIMVMGLLHT